MWTFDREIKICGKPKVDQQNLRLTSEVSRKLSLPNFQYNKITSFESIEVDPSISNYDESQLELLSKITQILWKFNRYRRKRPKVDASIFDLALSHTRCLDASEKREENNVSTLGRFRLWTSFESSPVSVKYHDCNIQGTNHEGKILKIWVRNRKNHQVLRSKC